MCDLQKTQILIHKRQSVLYHILFNEHMSIPLGMFKYA